MLITTSDDVPFNIPMRVPSEDIPCQSVVADGLLHLTPSVREEIKFAPEHPGHFQDAHGIASSKVKFKSECLPIHDQQEGVRYVMNMGEVADF